MEELLKQILTEIKGLKEEQRQTNKHLDRVEKRLDGLETRLDRVEKRLDGMDKEIAAIKADMASETQQIENTRMIQALRHSVEELAAQLHSAAHNLDVLTGTAATKNDIAELHAKFDLLNNRLFQQEAAIHQLKAVK